MNDPNRELEWLRRMRDLSHLLADQRDVRTLLPLILDAAIELTRAERGFLVGVQEGKREGSRVRIKVEVARGFAKETLQGTQGKVSRTVVERVLDQDRSVVTTSEADQDVRDISSVQARRVLSILCVPMRLRGTITAVLYLDHRFDSEVFTARDIPIVEAFADQAALAVETAQLLSDRATGAEKLGAAKEELESLKAEQEGARASAAVAQTVALTGRGERYGLLIGGSPVMRELYDHIERAARSTAPVLISGESGTGKELVAKEIHARGGSAEQPFLCENCAAIADPLLESELFGHRRGSFTGATADHEGLFVRAGRGSLFLDEVGDMSSVMQSKLLRVLQEGRVRPVGGEQTVPVSCRVVAATHRDLRALVRSGDFREDLYYRLDVLRINVPPLRKRPEDIPVLLAHFLVRETRGVPLEMTPKALELLVGYSWPGNVRELENEARRLSTLGLQRITARQLSDEVRQGRGLARAGGNYSGKTLKEVEREMVMAALRETGGNKARAARQLGIPKTSLYHLLERFDLR